MSKRGAIRKLDSIANNTGWVSLPDGVMWKETAFHKQKELEKRNPILKRGGYRL